MAPSHQVLFSTLLLASSAFASYADDSILYQRDASGLSALDSEDYLLARAILDTNDFDLADTVHAREADPDAEPIFPIFAALPALAAKGAALGAKGAAIGAKVRGNQTRNPTRSFFDVGLANPFSCARSVQRPAD